MTRNSITNLDMITYDKFGGFLDVNLSFGLPLNDEDKKLIDRENCIVTYFNIGSDNIRKYIYCDYFSNFDSEMHEYTLKRIKEPTGLYLSYTSKDIDPLELVDKIKEFNSI